MNKRAKILKHKDGSMSLVIKLGDADEITRLTELFNYTPVTDFVDGVKNYDWWKLSTPTFSADIRRSLMSIGGKSNVMEVADSILNHPAVKHQLD